MARPALGAAGKSTGAAAPPRIAIVLPPPVIPTGSGDDVASRINLALPLGAMDLGQPDSALKAASPTTAIPTTADATAVGFTTDALACAVGFTAADASAAGSAEAKAPAAGFPSGHVTAADIVISEGPSPSPPMTSHHGSTTPETAPVPMIKETCAEARLIIAAPEPPAAIQAGGHLAVAEDGSKADHCVGEGPSHSADTPAPYDQHASERPPPGLTAVLPPPPVVSSAERNSSNDALARLTRPMHDAVGVGLLDMA